MANIPVTNIGHVSGLGRRTTNLIACRSTCFGPHGKKASFTAFRQRHKLSLSVVFAFLIADISQFPMSRHLLAARSLDPPFMHRARKILERHSYGNAFIYRSLYLSILPLLLLVSMASVAQTVTGAVRGTVTDPTGAIRPLMPTVSAVNAANGVATTAKNSNAAGEYSDPLPADRTI